MTNYEALRANPELVLDINDAVFEEATAAVDEHLGRIGAQAFIDAAENPETFEAMQYAVVGGGKDRSDKAAILMPAPYANGVWPHMIARASAISHMAAEAGLRDDTGNIVPVVLTSSPGMKSSFGLDKQERSAVRTGNFDPIAEKHLGLFDELDLDIAGYVGASQATALAAPIINRLPGSRSGEGVPTILAEPPHGKKRIVLPVGRQLVNFALEGMTFKGQLADEGVEVIDEIFASGKASPDFEKGIIKQAKENLAIVRGFARGNLSRDLVKLALTGSKTTVIHGDESTIARREDMVSAVDEAIDHIENRYGKLGVRADLGRIMLVGTNHSLTDRLGRYVSLTAANLTR